MTRFTFDEFYKVVQGYRILEDAHGSLEAVLRDTNRCRACMKDAGDSESPVNLLVRALPLSRLADRACVVRYFRRVKRDDGFLRSLLKPGSSPAALRSRLVSERFSIGLLPWLDYGMLHRRSRETAIMVVGIDFKNWPAFVKNERDHYFPLDAPGSPSNVWGPTWRRFWSNILGAPYDENLVAHFLREHGVYFTNSVLCFGGADDPRTHIWRCFERCRPHMERQISIVRPRCLVSFADLGCRNVANILLKQNQNSGLLHDLADLRHPLRVFRQSKKRQFRLQWDSREVTYVPLYQPGWSNTAGYKRDYSALRKFLACGS